MELRFADGVFRIMRQSQPHLLYSMQSECFPPSTAVAEASLGAKKLDRCRGQFLPRPLSLFAEAKWVPRIRWKR